MERERDYHKVNKKILVNTNYVGILGFIPAKVKKFKRHPFFLTWRLLGLLALRSAPGTSTPLALS